tara:strand:- start:7115 stop:7978 length:864 start_codon:yes stop_codon:yes gene_type:complete
MKKINISTGGFKSNTALEIVQMMVENDIHNIELSGGKYDPSFEENILSFYKIANLSFHNYFPPPEQSFVLNLASSDNEVSKKSINHVIRAIDLSYSLGIKEYSIHAGFRIDPKVSELGKTVSSKKNLIPLEESKSIFYKNLYEITNYAKNKNINIYIENNVVTKTNLNAFGENPFLLASQDDLEEFIKIKPSCVKLLIDVAHLKVSANTLKFNPVLTLKNLKKNISAYHLSENQGLKDTNDRIDSGSWFWKYLNKDADFFTLEVYKQSIKSLKDQYKLVNNYLVGQN